MTLFILYIAIALYQWGKHFDEAPWPISLAAAFLWPVALAMTVYDLLKDRQ